MFPDIYKQLRPRSAWATAQSDLGLFCLLTELLVTIKCINGEQNYYAQNYVNLHIVCMLEGTFARCDQIVNGRWLMVLVSSNHKMLMTYLYIMKCLQTDLITQCYFFFSSFKFWGSLRSLTKFAWICNMEITKNWSEFGDLDLFFKVSSRKNWKLRDTFLFAQYFVNQSLASNQTSWTYNWDIKKNNGLDYGDFDLIFNVTATEKKKNTKNSRSGIFGFSENAVSSCIWFRDSRHFNLI